MTVEKVTRAPGKTAAQRQAERRDRVNGEVERGRVARYQVESFKQLVARAGALQITFQIPPGLLPYEEPLQRLNEIMLAIVRAEETERQKAGAAAMSRAVRVEPTVPPQSGSGIPAPETPAPPVDSATVPPPKVGAKTRESRKRVGK